MQKALRAVERGLQEVEARVKYEKDYFRGASVHGRQNGRNKGDGRRAGLQEE